MIPDPLQREAGRSGWSSSWDDTTPAKTPPAPPGPAAPDLTRSGGGSRWRNLAITGVVLVAAVAIGAWLLLRPRPASLTVDGLPITNAAAVLQDAETALAQVVAADDSATTDDTACFIGPPTPDTGDPSVICGPVLLGTSPPGQPWLLASVSWNASQDSVTGEFDEFDGTTTGSPGQLLRPDGRAPAPTDLQPPTSGLRAVDGAKIVDVEQTLQQAREVLVKSAQAEGAATDDSTKCWAGTTIDNLERTVFTEEIWCGPVLTVDSKPSEFWVSTTVSTSDGDLPSTASFEPPSSFFLTTVGLDGTRLWRPDNSQPPTSTDLELPDAEPVAPEFAEALDNLPGEVDTRPVDGLMVTPGMTWTITGVAAVPQVGSGPEALVAAPDHELLVVESRFAPSNEGGFVDGGTATLVVDGRRRPIDGWLSVGPDTTALVVSVPSDANEVILEVLSEGVVQSMSLRTGELQPGAPAGIYRSQDPVGVFRPLRATVALPGGESATAAAVLASVRLRGWDSELGWAPDGQVFVMLDIANQTVDTPCCDLAGLDVTTAVTLQVAGQSVAALEQSGSTAMFAIPVDAATIDVVLTAIATFTDAAGQAQSATSEPAILTVELPQ